MFQLFINFSLSALVIIFTAILVPGFEIHHMTAAVVACILLGFFNFVLRPILIYLNIPVNFLSLGLLSFVSNALLLNISTGLIDGPTLSSWTAAIIGAMVLSLAQMMVDLLTPYDRKFSGQ